MLLKSLVQCNTLPLNLSGELHTASMHETESKRGRTESLELNSVDN